MSFKKKIIYLLLFIETISSPALAQVSEAPRPSGTRKQMATIVYSGLAGFVLGLSTLSFYGRPQDKLGNLGIGFGLGIIIGSIYTSYNATSDPSKFYGREVGMSSLGVGGQSVPLKFQQREFVFPIYSYTLDF